MFSHNDLYLQIKMMSRTFKNKFLFCKSSFKNKWSSNKYALVIILFINIGTSSSMPRPQVQISSISHAEERSPVSEPFSSIHHSSSVGDLLTSLFRQTIYNRIENLLLDPGRPSMVKRRIIDSAVRNYHNQQYSAPPKSKSKEITVPVIWNQQI